jgi:hypothetical protein
MEENPDAVRADVTSDSEEKEKLGAFADNLRGEGGERAGKM